MQTETYPAIMVEVPHQRKATAYAVYDAVKLREICELNAGDNWEWPGHFENVDENGDGDWVSDATIDDYLRAFSHDLSYGTVLWKKNEALEFLARECGHQAIRACIEVRKACIGIGWLEEEVEEEETEEED